MPARRRREAGFTLVELMVCIVIFFLIALAVQQVFNMVVRVWRVGDARLQMFQDGRFALDTMSTSIRGALRPGYYDWDHDGDIDATDTGTTGIRFVGVNNASQAAASVVNSGSIGIGYGYKQSDAYGFFANIDGDVDVSDISGFTYGCNNATASLRGVPCIYQAKKNTNETYEATPAATPFAIQPTVSAMRPGYDGTTSYASTDPAYYNVQDLQVEYYYLEVLSGSQFSYWDSAQTTGVQAGKAPTMMKVLLQMQDERKVCDPEWVSTFILLQPQTGL